VKRTLSALLESLKTSRNILGLIQVKKYFSLKLTTVINKYSIMYFNQGIPIYDTTFNKVSGLVWSTPYLAALKLHRRLRMLGAWC
jgi:hypothetical protein